MTEVHETVVEKRLGQRMSTMYDEFYRWHCTRGCAGRWTRQKDTAERGAELHNAPRVYDYMQGEWTT